MMNKRTILMAATCIASMYGSSLAIANDSPVMQSQINAPNGVAGLDADKNLILGQGADATKTRSVHFTPGNNNIANTDVYIWCDRGIGTDSQGHCHFDNLRYGNTWEMNNSLNVYNSLRTGAVKATSGLALGKSDVNAPEDASPPKIEFSSTTDPYVVADTLMAGGHDSADRVFSKWSCFNISGGDQGGVCQNFGDHTGHEANYRNGAGLQDGINVSTQIDNSSALDVIGGGRKSADGVIYTVSYTPGSVIIKPALSKKELSLLRFQMRIWTNMTDGSFETTSSGTNPNARNTQTPAYYIGYWNGENKTNATSTELTVTTYWVQGAPESRFGWYRTGSLKTGLFPAAPKAPGENAGDIIDGKLAGTDPAHTSGLTSNAIYLGGPDQVFNNYTLEVYNPNSDSRVSSYDNEFDHWMKTTADNQVVSRGATYVWMGSNAHKLATGSWMMRLAGALVQPVGLWIDGVYPGGYLLKSDDAFVNFSHQGAMASEIGASQFATGLGQAVADNQNWGRLAYFASRDGLANSSFHLGMSRSGGTQGQQDSVDCGGNCVQQGQLVFDPLGYRGGIGLGVGQGKNTQTPVVVDGAGYTHIQKSLDTVLKLSEEHTLSTADCGATLLTGKKITTEHDLPVGCKIAIIPTVDNLQIAGGAWTVMNWIGGGGPSPVYTVDKAYREITLRVVDDNWGQKYYTLAAK